VRNLQARALIFGYQRDATRVLYEHYFGRPGQEHQELLARHMALLEEHVDLQRSVRYGQVLQLEMQLGVTRRRHFKIARTPEEIFRQVNEMVLSRDKTYREIVAYLEQKGYPISHSAVGRYALEYVSNLKSQLRGEA